MPFLKQEQAAAGRVWLLCRYLDSDGRGWLPVKHCAALTRRKAKAEGGRRKNSSFILHPASLPVFGWRRLRQILGRGEGLFWERDDAGRLWVFRCSTGCGYSGRGALAKSAGDIVPNRRVDGHDGAGAGIVLRSLSRGTTGRPAHLPRHHHSCDRCAGTDAVLTMRRRRGYGVSATSRLAQGGACLAENDAYQHGNAVFQFIDYRGRHGKCGQTYAARQPRQQLHIHAASLHARQTTQSKRQIGRPRDMGRGESEDGVLRRRFWRSGKAAISSFAKQMTDECR